MKLESISVWKYLREAKLPVVLYGMGDGADKVLKAFDSYGIKVAGVMASDDFVRGQDFHGFTVKKLSQHEEELGEFIIALCFASQLPDIIAQIKATAQKHPTLVPSVPVFGDRIFDDTFISENSDKIDFAYSLMADEQSRRVYRNVLEFYNSGRLHYLDDVTTEKDEAFNNILRLGSNEVYVDLGAYNGDTIDEFLHYTGGSYRKIIALEPNEKNFSRLKKHCESMDRVELWKYGSYSRNTTLIFNDKAGRNSAIATEGVETRVARVDSLLCGIKAGYIKADVEGADYDTLLGMEQTMKMFKPKLNFGAYHRHEDIFELPILINKINPDYKIYLRHHPYIPAWDTNLYCI